MKWHSFQVWLGKRSKYDTLYDKLKAELEKRDLVLTSQEISKIERDVKNSGLRFYCDEYLNVALLTRGENEHGLLVSAYC